MMNMIRVVMLVFVLAAAYFSSMIPPTYALTCASPPLVQQEIEQSDVVFQGKVVQIKEGWLAVFQVERAWKGVDAPRIEIYSNGWDPFIFQSEYLMFGSLKDGKLYNPPCGNTGLWDESREALMQRTGLQPIIFGDQATKGDADRVNSDAAPAAWIILALTVLYLFVVSILKKFRTE
jgi:hypothetical protein